MSILGKIDSFAPAIFITLSSMRIHVLPTPEIAAERAADWLRTEIANCPKKENRLSSGCGPMVVAEYSAEALSALNRVIG